MGKKVKWFDTVQKILTSSEPDPVPVETEAKAAKSKDKSSFKKLWQFAKSSNNASTSAASAARQLQPPPPPPPSTSQPDQRQDREVVLEEERSLNTRIKQVDLVCPTEEVAAQATAETIACPTDTACEQGGRICPAEVVAGTADAEAAAQGDTRPVDTTPGARPARSKEDIAATRIQAACRGYLARRAHRERGTARLMSLVEGLAVKRQTKEALYCMQMMTRVQTQIHARRLKTEEDKKALKGQIKIKQSFDKAKIGEGWDHSNQTKEHTETVLTMKQEAASRRQRALAYAFSQQWRNRNPSSARTAPPPMFMDPGNPNWGWTWTERWMAAARPWETQTAGNNRRATAKSAVVRPRAAAISIQLPTTPGGRSSFRPPNWPSLSSLSTPLPRSPSVSGRTLVSASPRSGTLFAASSKLHRTKSLQPDRRTDERVVSSPATPRRGGSPLRAPGSGGGLQRTTSSDRPRSSQERAPSSPRRAGANATLLRTTSLRSETPRRLRLDLGSVTPAESAAENATAPVTPSYMQPTTSVRAKARCASPSPSSSPNKPDVTEKTLAPLRASSPSSVKKRLSVVVADKASASSPSTAKAERAKRHSQPPSPRTQLT